MSHGDELDVHVYTHIRKQSSQIICSQMLTYRNNNTPPSMVTALQNTVKPNGTHTFFSKNKCKLSRWQFLKLHLPKNKWLVLSKYL